VIVFGLHSSDPCGPGQPALRLPPSIPALLLLIPLADSPARAQVVAGQQSGGKPSQFQPSLRGRNNVLIVLADDMSVDTLPIYALDPSVPANLTPNIDELASHGVLFLNAYTNPLCSPTRSSLLTGEYPHHTGIGAVIESAQVSLPLGHLTLPEALRTLAPRPYETSAFGKWHLEYKLSPVACPMQEHGFQFFDGTLLQIAKPYCGWNELFCPSGGATQVNPDYMLSELFDEAISWISTRTDSWLCYFAPESPYQYPHVPPTTLQSIVTGPTCTECAQNDRDCWNAHVQAFDSKLGELIDSLGPAWWNHTTIVFTADNGTPNTLNTYWPHPAKGNLWDGGVHVPLIIAGRAVDQGRRGATEDGLVVLTDLYRTVTRLVGIPSLPPGVARDSVDLRPLLRDPPGPPVRQYAWAEKFKTNATSGPYVEHEVTIRDSQFKLLWNEDLHLARGLFDLTVDPFEQNNLMEPQIPPPGTPAGDAYIALTAQIAAQLGS